MACQFIPRFTATYHRVFAAINANPDANPDRHAAVNHVNVINSNQENDDLIVFGPDVPEGTAASAVRPAAKRTIDKHPLLDGRALLLLLILC